MTLTIVLFGYAAAVAVFAPRVLAGAWTLRAPRLAVALWHAASGSVLVAMVLAGVTCAAAPGLIEMCLAALVGTTGAAGVVTVAAGLVVPVLLSARLTVITVRVVRAQRSERQRHLDLLRMFGRHHPGIDATVVAVPGATVYCLPGTGRVVLTHAAVAMLDRSELRAVLAHERAHLAGRHHLLVGWASILAEAVPGVPIFRALKPATADLVELLADDRAVRREPGHCLAGAIATLGGGGSPAVGMAAAGGGPVLTRVERLLDPPAPLPVVTRLGGVAAAISMIALPVILAIVPAAGLVACPVLFG